MLPSDTPIVEQGLGAPYIAIIPDDLLFAI
jgi:hypothetical protein